ncbi:unnamed protein product [Brugia timori]|uniref:Uncharacterized protein n=1 Tax=Brugia timori TaxID=42155 RepID=A0A0R3QSH9_9BILA|nr:unnamed protein product [Brugia timori]
MNTGKDQKFAGEIDKRVVGVLLCKHPRGKLGNLIFEPLSNYLEEILNSVLVDHYLIFYEHSKMRASAALCSFNSTSSNRISFLDCSRSCQCN